MKGKRILITGGAGFIGKNIVEFLSKENEVIVLDKKISYFGNSIVADIRNKDWFEKIGKVDYIFHLAAVVGVDYAASHPEETSDTEITGMKNIIEFAKKNCKNKIIYTSTSSVYEALDYPTSYNTAKLFAEQLLRESGLRHTVVRLFNVYGKYQKEKMVTARFIKKASNNEDIIVFEEGNQTRDFTYIKDVTKIMISIADNNKADKLTLDIGTGKETKIKELAEMIKNKTNSSSKIIFKPAPKERRCYEVMRRKADILKMKEILGVECKFSLEKGIEKIKNLNWS